MLYSRLSAYERDLDVGANKRSVSHRKWCIKVHAPTCAWEWTFPNAVFYAWSLITTVGYGYIYPVTKSAIIFEFRICFYSNLGDYSWESTFIGLSKYRNTVYKMRFPSTQNFLTQTIKIKKMFSNLHF